ncbi:SAM-dependent methyltransferase [bacterium]|nr:SAM-dependent methyltransferase [bacterium]
MVKTRYEAGKRVLITLLVEFTDPQGKAVAEAEMRYFLHARRLTKDKVGGNERKIDPSQQFKASARMIAGLRAKNDRKQTGSAQQYDELAAGPHGTVLAESLSDPLPQLHQIVSPKTAHVDNLLVQSRMFRQVVLLGAGLDLRPFRLAGLIRPMTFFEIDLPTMLQERRLVMSNFEERVPVSGCMLAADFKTDNVGHVSMKCPDFDPTKPTMVIYEGCSMYFKEEQNTTLLTSVGSVLRNRSSVIWADMVTQAVVDGTAHNSAIAEFLDKMHQMGETFVFGCDEPVQFLRRCGFGHGNVVSAKEYLKSGDPTLSSYQFVVSRTDS